MSIRTTIRMRHDIAFVVLVCAALTWSRPALAQFSQEGPKLVGSGAVGGRGAQQGNAVSVSADGNTALVGGHSDSGGGGAAWVWIRSGAVWTQQGIKLVGSGAAGNAQQGYSVSLSADGTTALIGGPSDNGYAGAAWVWTRTGGIWTQQGSKLVGSGAVGAARQGAAVSLSADGNTALIGGPSDNSYVGAVWVWTRSGGVWTQAGSKLVGSGAVGKAQQGYSVCLSADGTTAIVGGWADDEIHSIGAAWIWTRSGGVWTQQGPKLAGSDAHEAALQGRSVSLSADGSTALIGGPGNNTYRGSAWVWARIGGVWVQQGPPLFGSDAYGPAMQGFSVSLSADGNTALVGGPSNSNPGGSAIGAAWVWVRSDGVWTQRGSKLVGSEALGSARQGESVALSGDGRTAIVGGSWDNGTGWPPDGASGAAWIFAAPLTPMTPPQMDGDRLADLAVWQPLTGQWTWLTAATAFEAARAGSKSWGRADWGDAPIMGDLDGDGIDDPIVFRSATGGWYGLTSSSGYSAGFSTVWGGVGDVPMLADMDGDDRVDMTVWRPSTGEWFWLKSSDNWLVGDTRRWGGQGDQPLLGDFDGDGRADMTVFRPWTGQWFWLTSSSGYTSGFVTTWGGQGDVPLLADLDGDRKSDIIVWRPSTGDWFWAESSSGYTTQGRVRWGGWGDIPLLADFDGDRRADVAVFRPSTATWYWLLSTSNNTAGKTVVFGSPGPIVK